MSSVPAEDFESGTAGSPVLPGDTAIECYWWTDTWDATAGLIFTDAEAHSGSLSMTKDPSANGTSVLTPWTGTATNTAEDFSYWFYLTHSPDDPGGGYIYNLWGAAEGDPREYLDWHIGGVLAAANSASELSLIVELDDQWYTGAGSATQITFTIPYGWAKIESSVTVDGQVRIAVTDGAGTTYGEAISDVGFTTAMPQVFGSHEIHVGKFGGFTSPGMLYIDDINAASSAPSPPDQPTGLTQIDATPGSVEVSWTPPASGAPPTSYDVRINSGPIDETTNTTYLFDGLEPGTTYNIEVRSRADNLVSDWISLEATTLSYVPNLTWGALDERIIHYGINHGVLYFDNQAVVWNGIVGLDESGQGETSVHYRDGVVYFTEVEPGDFEGTLTAFAWPDEFGECLGVPNVGNGLLADYQKPKPFGMSYRTLVGSGHSSDPFGHQIHILYNAVASLGSKQRETITEQVEPLKFDFEIVATPVKMPGLRPSAHYILDTRFMSTAAYVGLQAILYGVEGGATGRMPEPIELYDLMKFGSSIMFVDNGDDTWTAYGSSQNIEMTSDSEWVIRNVNGTDNLDGTYTLEDTP